MRDGCQLSSTRRPQGGADALFCRFLARAIHTIAFEKWNAAILEIDIKLLVMISYS